MTLRDEMPEPPVWLSAEAADAWRSGWDACAVVAELRIAELEAAQLPPWHLRDNDGRVWLVVETDGWETYTAGDGHPALRVRSDLHRLVPVEDTDATS